jgi:U6 snRNA-associated Sm-like protein LSm4
MLVELKDGETLNGHLVSCDTWMNLVLKEVVQTSPDGDRFFRIPQVYVRGNNVSFGFSQIDSSAPRGSLIVLLGAREQIKYLRVPDEIVDIVKEQQQRDHANRQMRGGGQRGDHQGGRGDRGGRGGRGPHRGRGRGRGS